MSRKAKFASGEYYHLYNRGVDKREIFLDDRDRERFLVLLHLANSFESFGVDKHGHGDWSFAQAARLDVGRRSVSIGAYCLMPNHFHLLVQEKEPDGVSNFMKKLSNGYTMYFNKKYQRTGSLFGGRFKAKHVNDGNYLKYQYAYIHLNPIGIIDSGWKHKQLKDKMKAKEFLAGYTFSSYHDYLGQRRGNVILEPAVFPKYFATTIKFGEMIDEWLNFVETQNEKKGRG